MSLPEIAKSGAKLSENQVNCNSLTKKSTPFPAISPLFPPENLHNTDKTPKLQTQNHPKPHPHPLNPNPKPYKYFPKPTL